MPTYQMQELLLRIGLALGAGILIAIVPIAHRKARWVAHPAKRIVCHLISLLALVPFVVYGWYLWNHFVPRTPAAPDPITYPLPPAGP